MDSPGVKYFTPLPELFAVWLSGLRQSPGVQLSAREATGAVHQRRLPPHCPGFCGAGPGRSKLYAWRWARTLTRPGWKVKRRSSGRAAEAQLVSGTVRTATVRCKSIHVAQMPGWGGTAPRMAALGVGEKLTGRLGRGLRGENSPKSPPLRHPGGFHQLHLDASQIDATAQP